LAESTPRFAIFANAFRTFARNWTTKETIMKRFWMLKGIKVLVFAAVALGALGFVVMSLWNALLPAITSLHTITFVQALGLLVLSRLLFGGFRRHGHWRHQMRARWQDMTPEQREQLRATLASHSGRCGPMRSTPSAPPLG
jgi:hypothetical protein